MKVIVMGCGRIGAALAAQLGGEGHDVRVVDRDRGRAELRTPPVSQGLLEGITRDAVM